MSATPSEGELVQLYVYDLSGGLARMYSQMLLGRQIEAIYHTSVVVGGLEHFFGGGINVAQAGSTPFGRPMQVMELGYTQLPEDIRAELLADLSERYTPQAYSLFHNNCNTFSSELAQLFCGSDIPPHITGLPAEVLATPFGQMIAPMLSGLEGQLRGMQGQAIRPHNAGTLAAPAPAGAAGAAATTAQPTPVQPAVILSAAPVAATGDQATVAATAATEPAAAAVEPAVGVAPAVEVEGTSKQAAAAAAFVAAAAAEEDAAPAVHSAEIEIEAAVAAGMMREAEESLHPSKTVGNAGTAQAQPAAEGGEPQQAPATVAGAGTMPGEVEPASSAAAGGSSQPARLAAELEVAEEFKRLMAGGRMMEHDAQARAMAAVAARRRQREAEQRAAGV